MGISGLIPFLDKASSKLNLRDIKGSTVAIDTYCWLHKGAFGCAEKLSRGEDTDLYIQYCLKYVTLLLEYNIKPILVFDGRHLPAKALTEKRRREGRDNSKKRAAELLRAGKIEEARSHMRRSVDVTHEMALRVIKECRKRNVDCIVAPYEADAQMAYLNKLNVAQYIITEDSDLVLFGCKKIIFKLDLTGNGLLVEADKLHHAMGCREDKYSFDRFRIMCILSGCDYLDSLPGIGLAKACKFVLKTEETDMQKALLKIPQYLNMRNLIVTEEYIEGFLKAEATFRHMYVYDPFKRKMVRLNSFDEMPTDVEYCSNAGSLLDNDVAFQLALGNINPFSLKVLDKWSPDEFALPTGWGYKVAKHKSIWQSNFTAHVPKIKRDASDIRCAIQFKKVNYIGIADKKEVKDEGPREDEIVSLYKEDSPSPTRMSPCSSPTESHAQGSSQKKHNPFAKARYQVTSPFHNHHNSLLKCLSPQKSANDDASPNSRFERLTQVKRMLIEPTTQEVKSRFFATNVTLLSQLTKAVNGDPLDESSMKRKSCGRDEDEFETDPLAKRKLNSETGDLKDNLENSMDSGLGGNLSAKSSSSSEHDLNQSDCSRKDKEIDSNIITISDSDSSFQIKPSLPIRPSIPKQRARCVGLPKPKGSSKKTVPEGQTKLSMFGFQKKPLLK